LSHLVTPCHTSRLLKQSKQQLQLPYETAEDEDDDSSPDIMAAAAVAAAMVRPPLPPHGTPPLIYGRGVPLNPPGAPVADHLGLNPFGPLPAEPSAAATAAVSGGAQAAAAAAVGISPDTHQQQQQQYLGSSSTSSLDGSIGGQWPVGEASSSGGGGRSGCPVYVMLPLDTVWVVEREDQKVGL
jgi:hypothetical protein